MPRACAPATLEHIAESDQVGVDVFLGMRHGVPHARLSGEVHHHLERAALEGPCGRLAIGELDPLEAEAGSPVEPGEPRLLERHVVVVVQVVKAEHLVAAREEPVAKRRADEPRSTGDEHSQFASPIESVRPVKSPAAVYIIVITWLYVTILMAATEASLVGAILTFLVYGLGPLALFVYLFRRRRKPSVSVRELADDPHARNSQKDE